MDDSEGEDADASEDEHMDESGDEGEDESEDGDGYSESFRESLREFMREGQVEEDDTKLTIGKRNLLSISVAASHSPPQSDRDALRHLESCSQFDA